MSDNRHQRLRRARPVVALAAVSFLVGAIFGANHTSSPSVSVAESFTRAWSHGDYAAMYADITPAAQHSVSASEFAADYEHDMRTAWRATPAHSARGASRCR